MNSYLENPYLENLTEEDFKAMPLVVEGESKEVRYAGGGLVVIRFKPTIYSFTHNRAGIVEGSDTMRLRATRVLVAALKARGVQHAYREVTDRWVLADLLIQPEVNGMPKPFRPPELDEMEVNARLRRPLPSRMVGIDMAPPIEVVVKAMHSGTSKHRYVGMHGHPVRSDHPTYGGVLFHNEEPYPEPLVRFDWRNPLKSREGKWLADEVLGDQQANWFIDVAEARRTALKVFGTLGDILNEIDVVPYDLCLFISQDGKTVFGEISQDCGRYRHFDHGSLDKDVWRAGGSSEQVLQKWGILADLLETWWRGQR